MSASEIASVNSTVPVIFPGALFVGEKLPVQMMRCDFDVILYSPLGSVSF